MFFLPCSVQNSTVTVALSGAITAVSDVLRCEFCVIGENFAMTSPSFCLHVKAITRNDSAIEATSDFTAFEQAVYRASLLPDADDINTAVTNLNTALLQINHNTVADRSVTVPKTDFFGYSVTHTKNIYNQSKTVGYSLKSTDGTLQTNADYSVSPFIELYESGNYFLCPSSQAYWGNTVTVCWYNEFKEFLSSASINANSSSARTITAPALAKYMRFSVVTSEFPQTGGIMVYHLATDETVAENEIPAYITYNTVKRAQITDSYIEDMFEGMLDDILAQACDYADSSGGVIDDTATGSDSSHTWSASKISQQIAACEYATDDLTDFPACSSSDSGKRLTVKSDGTLGWEQTFFTRTCSISSAAWSNNRLILNIPEITGDMLVLAYPAAESTDIWLSCNIRAVSHSGSTVTFSCADVPASAVTIVFAVWR